MKPARTLQSCLPDKVCLRFVHFLPAPNDQCQDTNRPHDQPAAPPTCSNRDPMGKCDAEGAALLVGTLLISSATSPLHKQT